MASDVVHRWAPVYPHLRYEAPIDAITWLTRVFGFRERVRMDSPLDPEGHQWEFAQLLGIVGPEAWGAIRVNA